MSGSVRAAQASPESAPLFSPTPHLCSFSQESQSLMHQLRFLSLPPCQLSPWNLMSTLATLLVSPTCASRNKTQKLNGSLFCSLICQRLQSEEHCSLFVRAVFEGLFSPGLDGAALSQLGSTFFHPLCSSMCNGQSIVRQFTSDAEGLF